MWLLNSAVVLTLYDFTLRALVGNVGRNIDTKIEKRLAEWPKGLPKHAGVTSWLYRQLAVEIADTQDCVALIDADGEMQLANITIEKNPEFRYRNYFTATFTGHRWQSNNESSAVNCLVTDRALTDGGHLIYGVAFDNYLGTIQRLDKLRFWGLLVTAVVPLVVLTLVMLSALRQIRVILDVCERVASGDLKQRIPMPGHVGSDLDRIAAAVNNMLDQIEQLMDGIREISDAIAHDLKTPLARLRGQLELLLSISDRSDDAIDAVIAEADQVLNAFNALLRIAQLEQGTRRQAFVHFDFRSVLQQARDIYELVFADKNIRFWISVNEENASSFPVYGDRDLWLQAVSNLLDNAYKYTPEGGAVTIELQRESVNIKLRIRDTGPGIPSGERRNVFKRFYRLEKHRSQKGTGLGLSLVAAVCKVHNAAIELDNNNGLIIDITIPLDQHADEIPPPAKTDSANA
ncbi:MAG TPA: HAMP domain-containing sensor histidine kinase [Spongiibacteraceae bacterium]|nr:HAMP domain-containing sensor histidine kinase [Spongiibacteraceae bacterium]